MRRSGRLPNIFRNRRTNDALVASTRSAAVLVSHDRHIETLCFGQEHYRCPQCPKLTFNPHAPWRWGVDCRRVFGRIGSDGIPTRRADRRVGCAGRGGGGDRRAWFYG
ncbi:hypothetical protein D3C79_715230 [compost metagenome]